MAESRKRKDSNQIRRADIPSSQRTTGHLLWALLVGVFGLMIAYFATSGGWTALITGAAIGAVVGWLLGRKMERDSKS